MYAVDVSPDLISSVTDAVRARVAGTPAGSHDPVVFFDALRVKIRAVGAQQGGLPGLGRPGRRHP
jgi:transposase-like protein